MSRTTPPPAPQRRTLAGGLTIHPVGIGCWAIGGPAHNLGLPMGWSTANDTDSLAGLERAFELGANLYDTADVYGHGHSERLIGNFLRHVPRHDVVISSKTGYFAGTAAHPYVPSHMRHQLETTLENLDTDHIDIYFLHTADFGDDDRYLDGALEQMRDFRGQGVIRCIGMRGPHRLATDRLTLPKSQREDKYARFRRLLDRVRPDYLAVRFNALTPPDGGQDIFALAAARGASVLINKPLAQGLLTGKYHPDRPPTFGPGDHRLRKRWFTPQALKIINDGMAPIRDRFGTPHLARVFLRYCLQQAPNTAVLTGFTNPHQVEQNLTTLGAPLTTAELNFIRSATLAIQRRLDQTGEVFLDEHDKHEAPAQ
ncbi:aldo/keto reductase [Actinomadura viridis]|uniref:aldo/keto reductase n=1 Tax=Actinomadura viridis TaxID=58110 RepID=UPI0036ACBDA6